MQPLIYQFRKDFYLIKGEVSKSSHFIADTDVVMTTLSTASVLSGEEEMRRALLTQQTCFPVLAGLNLGSIGPRFMGTAPRLAKESMPESGEG